MGQQGKASNAASLKKHTLLPNILTYYPTKHQMVSLVSLEESVKEKTEWDIWSNPLKQTELTFLIPPPT